MKIRHLLFAATVSLGMTAAEAGMPAARALTRAFFHPAGVDDHLNTFKQGIIQNFFAMMESRGVSFSRAEAEEAVVGLEKGLEVNFKVNMEKDPLLANLAGNLARDAHPEDFVEDMEDFTILAGLLARASGDKVTAPLAERLLSERLARIRAASPEELVARLSRLTSGLPEDMVKDKSLAELTEIIINDEGSQESLKSIADMRKDLKWQKYLRNP